MSTIRVNEATNQTVTNGLTGISARIEDDRSKLLAWLESHRALSGGTTDEAHAEHVNQVNRFYNDFGAVYQSFGTSVTKVTEGFKTTDVSLGKRYSGMTVPHV
ncbi:hypothetical protein [Tsukamurella ocularis]|uniref:hypothetical protein n=1 Tax=Tsukamurella ocularis TaxID=1970234 RepID=UPI0021677DE9|nr:hypothetical protein [Tsukamurella ocularis]MCS3853323.1 hypothetical protein [Tsukamurella ocularis]